ncbi:STAS-like domain-containing protein [Nodosilinea sp. E11]|uniref:STAS-like domain-containing protein n=1 Tax=Nodosilinea sp. E11 TaxID=3037479 RepID=UPI002934D7A2|nr:STAS-like domain-containing protein [Nodosilinea sp. E11]WOD39567.1 STAS-like domain-containing protein [Nodosilinea sp. E11]
MILNIHDITGEYAISADHGQQVYDHIHRDLLDGRSIELNFAEVKVFASAFFNFAIGQLLKDISTDDLNQLLKISNLNSSGTSILHHIITSARRYYSDSQYQAAADAVMEEYADSFDA